MPLNLTVGHQLEMPLESSLDLLKRAWSSMLKSQTFKEICREYGIAGWCWSVEITYGDEGWHPHMHVALFLEPRRRASLRRLASEVGHLWVHHVEGRGGYAGEWGCTLEPLPLSKAGYLFKDPLHRGRREGRTPWHLLQDGMRGDAEAADLFREYAGATYHKQRTGWSGGFRERLELEA